MNLKLNDWNEACQYADTLCEELNKKGYNTKATPYTMYDRRKGLHLQVFDNNGDLCTQYATGIHSDLSSMKRSIAQMAKRIEMEV